jgi:hypothetical protein
VHRNCRAKKWRQTQSNKAGNRVSRSSSTVAVVYIFQNQQTVAKIIHILKSNSKSKGFLRIYSSTQTAPKSIIIVAHHERFRSTGQRGDRGATANGVGVVGTLQRNSSSSSRHVARCVLALTAPTVTAMKAPESRLPACGGRDLGEDFGWSSRLLLLRPPPPLSRVPSRQKTRQRP